jgi:hypothetical protein
MGRFRSKSGNIKCHREKPGWRPYPSPVVTAPSYASRGLVNLVSEIEARLTGASPGPRLDPSIGDLIPEGRTYVLVVFDGLGVVQLDHPAARPLAASHRATIDTTFPSTTSVALASLVTGLTPSRHGLVSHMVWLEELGRVVNTLKWVDLTGKSVAFDYGAFLPRPNLWERLRQRGVEPVTVQPGAFSGSPLSRLLYRGARFEPAWNDQDLIEATIDLAEGPQRLILTYVWQVDYAGHVSGLGSTEFSDAMRLAARTWEELGARLPADVVLLGTADHGLIEYREEDKLIIREPPFDSLRYAGDPRGLHLWGDGTVIAELAAHTGGELVDLPALLGPEPSAAAIARTGSSLLLAPEGKVLLPPGFDKRLRSYHGGWDRREREVPILIA